MSEPKETNRTTDKPETVPGTKKAYHKPEFRFEHVFEVRALSCGKVSTTQSQCSSTLSAS
jgi:hypothetical protein